MMDLRKKCNLKLVETPASFAPNGIAANANPLSKTFCAGSTSGRGDPALKPVTFRYKEELDPAGVPQFGLVAEQVEKVDPSRCASTQKRTPCLVKCSAMP
jgi:hypothetical protein